jgi:signal transduction histidine kinase
LLTGFFLGASLLTIYQLRLRSIKAHNKKLEKEVKERTVSLQQANSALMEMNKLIQEQKEEIQTQAQELEESNNKIRSINHTLEEMVEIRTADLKKSNQELDNFVYRVSHDIRAPLSSMLGLVELMKNKKNLAQLDEYLNMSAKSINKLDSFVKDILDYSRNSRMEVEYQAIDFHQLIENTLDELQYMDKAQRLHIIREIQLTSPFYNDPRRLHIIFRNLFSNAIKYQNSNIDNPFLRVKITSVKEGIVIVLEDNGIGIAAEYTDRAFDMFFRCSESSTGSGIGLYIVKETVEKLCGKIRLESQLGIGTVITIELPDFRARQC